MQIYAPTDENPNAFHRTIYIFLSPDGSTLSSPGAVKAFRCQLARKNLLYPFDPPKKEAKLPPALPAEHLETSLANDPWKSEAHAADTAGKPSTSSTPEDQAVAEGKSSDSYCPLLFTETELVVEPEPEEASNEEEDSQAATLLEQYKLRNATEGEYTEEELPTDIVDSIENAITDAQRHFAAFAARVAKEPAQVLRYCFEQGAVPLCPAPDGIPAADAVPRCERCGGERRFEFQVMPQLLNHLGVDPSDPKSPDWGTIAVYSCAKSCGGGDGGAGGENETSGGVGDKSNSNSTYVEEWVWVQPPS